MAIAFITFAVTFKPKFKYELKISPETEKFFDKTIKQKLPRKKIIQIMSEKGWDKKLARLYYDYYVGKKRK